MKSPIHAGTVITCFGDSFYYHSLFDVFVAGVNINALRSITNLCYRCLAAHNAA